MKKLIQLFIFITMLFLLTCTSTTIDDKVIDITKIDTSKATMYQEDFVYLVKKIKEVHPIFAINDYKNIDIKEFDKLAYNIYKYLGKNDKDFNDYKFCLYAKKILVKLNDGHTALSSKKFDSIEKTLPIMVSWFGDELYIIDAIEEYNTLLNKRIIKIADIDVLDVRDMVNNFVFGDNIYSKKLGNAFFLARRMMLQLLELVENDSVKIEYVDSDNNNDLKTAYLPFDDFYTSYRSDFNSKIKNFGRNEVTYNSNTTNLWFKYLPEYNAMYLKINSLLNDGYDYIGEYKKLFSSVKENTTKHLIIDLRDCAGGVRYVMYQLLSYLKNEKNDCLYSYKSFYRLSKEAEKKYHFFTDADYDLVEKALDGKLYEIDSGIINLPKADAFAKYFNDYMPYPDEDMQYDGDIYFLCGNNTFSLASIFSALAKDNGYGKLIGEPTGCASISYGWVIKINLPQTMLDAYIAPYLCVRAKEDALLSEPDAVYPDVYIPTTFEDYINGKDPCWEYLVENVFNKQEN